MSHRTLIAGTSREVSGGKTLVGGTGREFAGGKTLVGGTGYNISFLPEQYVLRSGYSFNSSLWPGGGGMIEIALGGIKDSYTTVCMQITVTTNSAQESISMFLHGDNGWTLPGMGVYRPLDATGTTTHKLNYSSLVDQVSYLSIAFNFATGTIDKVWLE